jgi:hypothetical protein
VVNSLLISSVLFRALSTGRGTTSTNSSKIIQSDSVQDNQVLILNLELAIKTIEENGWSLKAFSSLVDSLMEIEMRLNSNGISSTKSLKTLVVKAEVVIKKYNSGGITELMGKRNIALDSISRIKNMLGMKEQSNNAFNRKIGPIS